MKVNFTGVSSVKKQGCGIADTSITDVTFGESKQKKTPFVAVTTASENGALHTEEYYLSPKALPKLRHLLEEGLGLEGSQLDRDITEEQMKSMLVGKKVRLKFSGEEYIRKDSTLGIKVTIGFGNFAENMKVPKERSALSFNEGRDIAKTSVVTEDSPF